MPFPPLPAPRRLAAGTARSAARLGATVRNLTEVVRTGGLETGEEPAPYEVVARRPVHRLRRYYPGAVPSGSPPVVLVPPLMMKGDVYDVSSATSAVRILAEKGVDPWVVDFGAPERERGGLRRTLSDHVLAVDEAIDQVRAATGRDVHLAGYSQGGMFCYQAAAYRRSAGLASVITFGSPVDVQGSAARLSRLPEDLVVGTVSLLADTVLPDVWVPAWAGRLGFQLLDPVKSARQQVRFLLQLHDREALLARERQRRFLRREAWVAWPGPAMAELARQFVAQNRMLSGGALIGDRMVTLADISCPVLCFVGETDSIAGPAYVRALRRAAPLAEMYEVPLDAGHFGLVAGRTASTRTWPAVAGWVRWREGRGDLPAAARPLREVPADRVAGAGAPLGAGIELAAGLGLGLARTAVTAAGGPLRNVRALAREASRTLPGLSRLQRVAPDTRISLGLLVRERAAGSPDETCFVSGGRGYTYAQADRRVDAVVRGLISVGIRPGEVVGVLMGTRPSALALVVALNRLGAAAAMLRPGGDVRREAELGGVTRVIADPEHASAARDLVAGPVLVLGGGGARRDLGPGLIDMERIVPARVRVPAWYAANPGCAQDAAFLLFTGKGTDVRVSRITNRRWAISAFGTASAAALDTGDTVYGIAPLHHPSGLLTAFGGAVAGRARLALSSASFSDRGSLDPETFWAEVRRYGVTVVSYTWTLLHDLIEAPPGPAEEHHPVRLFAGSGMPGWLWRRVAERFPSARVLEFFAATAEDVVLVNLAGTKPGSKGRPLPGTAEVRVASYDPDTGDAGGFVGGFVEGPDGLVVECAPGETGMLLAAADRGHRAARRGVFAADDAWLPVGALFRRDEDGDFWLVEHGADLIRTASGAVPSIPVEDAIGELDAVGLVAVYGVAESQVEPAAAARSAGATEPAGAGESVVAAVTVRRGRELSAADVERAVKWLEPAARPSVVRIVGEIPRTTWFRPLKSALRAEGVSAGSRGWRRDPDTGRYLPL